MRAIITGISGQDGAYLAKVLIQKGYEVVGTSRSQSKSFKGLEYLRINDQVKIEQIDLANLKAVKNLITEHNPVEIYNLAAQSSVGSSFEHPLVTIQFNIMSVMNLCESIKIINPNIKLYQASSSEMYGKVRNLPITENTVFNPISPYGVSKVSAHLIIRQYRQAYNLKTYSGILFNHESYLRDSKFFVKKVIRTALNISKGKGNELRVGNIEQKRDFGYAPSYVEVMHEMLQHDPDDYLICSGISVSLSSIVHYVFDKLNISRSKIVIDPELYRPTEIGDIYGDPTKAKNVLGWEDKTSFFEILDRLIMEEDTNWAE